MKLVRPATGVFLAAVTSLLACDNPDDEPTGNTGSFTIAISPSSTVLMRGGALAFVTVTLTRTGGFSGAVTLTISGLPIDVSPTMEPAVLSGNTVVSRIELTPPASTLGTFTITVTGTSGDQQSSATFVLTLTEFRAFELAPNPVALSVDAGGSATTAITVYRTNLTAGVTFSLVNPPAGITGSFSDSPALGDATVLTLSAAPNVAPGIHAVTIRGTTPGVPDRTVVLGLTVLPAPSGAGVEYLYCDPANAPVFFAFQDGTAGWQPVAPTTTGGAVRFAFTLTSGHGAVLSVTRSSVEAVQQWRSGGTEAMGRRKSPGIAIRDRFKPMARSARAESQVAAAVDVFQTDVWYAAAAELASDGRLNCTATLPVKTVRGTVAGVSAGQYGIVSLGGITEIYNGAQPATPLVFAGVRTGPVDLAATRATPGLPPDRGLVLRNLNIADGGSTPTIDFNGPDAIVPVPAPVTVLGSAGDNLEIVTGLITATSDLVFWSDLAPSPAIERRWAGLRLNDERRGDFYNLIVFASPANAPNDFRVALQYIPSVRNDYLELGPTVSLPTATLSSGGSFPRYRFRGALPPEYDRGVGISVVPRDVGNVFSIYASASWLTANGGAGSYDLTMPDVAGLPSYPTAARVPAGVNSLMIDAFGFSGPGVFDLIPTILGRFSASVRFGQLVVP